MAFIQPCFIRKNTPELRNKLEELGYEPCYSMVKYPDKYSNLFVSSNYGDRYFGYDDENMQLFNYEINELIKSKALIDCGTNEKLFLALVALRDDIDINQWIIDEANECFGHDNSWMICDKDDMNDRAIYTHYRKATVEEIIEHFK